VGHIQRTWLDLEFQASVAACEVQGRTAGRRRDPRARGQQGGIQHLVDGLHRWWGCVRERRLRVGGQGALAGDPGTGGRKVEGAAIDVIGPATTKEGLEGNAGRRITRVSCRIGMRDEECLLTQGAGEQKAAQAQGEQELPQSESRRWTRWWAHVRPVRRETNTIIRRRHTQPSFLYQGHNRWMKRSHQHTCG